MKITCSCDKARARARSGNWDHPTDRGIIYRYIQEPSWVNGGEYRVSGMLSSLTIASVAQLD